MAKIAVLDDYQDVALTSADWSAVQARAQVTVFRDHVKTVDALIERLLPFDAVCVMRERTPLGADVLAHLPNLKFIASTASHNASIDLGAARARTVVVSGTGSRSSGAPEMTWALIHAAARHIPAETALLRAGGWQMSVGVDLAGKTLGVMGLGNIGKRVAAVGCAFGMRVIAWSANLTVEAAQAAGAERVAKDVLLREADWLTLHLVLSDRTRGIVGADELAMMKQTAWLVNTSRGPLVDEAALIEALGQGTLTGAALDVFDLEPLPSDHAFRTLKTVIASPHLGFVTEATYGVFFRETVENLLAWLDGRPLRQM